MTPAARLTTDDRLVYAPLPLRPRVTWPGGKGVAVWHAPNVEHYDYVPPGGGSPQGRVAAPDVQHYMHRAAGNRVALWRMLRAVDRYEIPSTVSLSLTLLEDDPDVRDAMRERDWEVMSHGISNLRPIYDLSWSEEDAFLAQSQRLAETYYGTRLRGMLGPKISGTDATPDLMVAHGMTYHADWIHDEQPRPLATRDGGRLVSMPYSYMLNDVPMLHAKNLSPEDFVALVLAQVDRLARDAERDGQARVACLATHPFLLGQPHMLRYLEEIFDRLRGDDRLWLTRAGDIADHYLTHHYDTQLAHARALAEEVAA
ncbi:polysaccharide deacetylase family protein [Isoptericola sp. AK164]|uniref:polysaccharide deacetylase family protein n=1 Tax=Isoptericola sp. AK164 TaxID=3024246 RepID=UPI0024187DB2|nr:polysaccharide deacetylase family protein [Isoptericola sp. AK164]